jgi:glutathione S-transferase
MFTDEKNIVNLNFLFTGYNHATSGITAASLLSIEDNYPHVVAWAERIKKRPAVERGMKVCRPEKWGK